MQSDQNQSNKPPPEEKLGKLMMLIGWIMAILLLTWLFGSWEENQTNPNSEPTSRNNGDVIEVTLQRNKYGHYLVSGEVNNKSALFLLDTGATLVAVPENLEKALGLVRGRQGYVNTANGRAISYSTVINELKVGDIVLHNVRASISPGMQGKEILLGMSVLKQLEFTQRGNQLTLRQFL